MNAEIVSIGSEIVAGRIADTNAAYMSERLEALGFRVVRHTAVGDRAAEIAEVLTEVSQRADLAVVTGGLGPTRDDMTREVVSSLTNAELIEDERGRENIIRLFAGYGVLSSTSNFKQACAPRGSRVIPNAHGTACGFETRFNRCRFFFLPGVPLEMEAMFTQDVETQIGSLRAGTRLVRALHVYGMPESVIGERLHDLMAETANPELATQASGGIITLRLTAQSDTVDAARKLLSVAEAEVRGWIGNAIFGADGCTLEEAVALLLEKRPRTLAVAESCTGGMVGARLTEVPGISRFLLEDVVAYSNEAKIRRLNVPAGTIERYGAVSRETAEAMAAGARSTTGADVAISVTGIAGPAGGTPEKPVGLVFFGIADATGTRSEGGSFRGNRQQVRDRATKRALNMLRLYLMESEPLND
jgi:nicotinamide-nucleotide amidase